MKNIMWKYFTANNTQKYIDVLRGMVEKYNNTYHRSIKLKHTDARKPTNYKHINNALYAIVKIRTATPPKFHVGDTVRIVRKKGTFEKGFTPNWTEEVFTITTVKATKPPIHTIEDTRGTFYEQELQTSVQEIYRIERVFKRGKAECLSSGKVTAVHSIRQLRYIWHIDVFSLFTIYRKIESMEVLPILSIIR